MKLIKTHNALFYILILFTAIVVIVGESTFLKDKIQGIVQKIRFTTITINMDKKSFDNITYYYSNKKDETYINTIKEHIREGEDKTYPLLGQTSMYPLNIVIFTTTEAFGKEFKINPKEFLAVTNLNYLYIPGDNINSYVFVHEYTHYKMNSFCERKDIQKFKIPSWFKEGVAEYASSTFFPTNFKNTDIHKIQDFRELDKINHRGDSEAIYIQGYIAVKKIIELKGEDSIKQILTNTKSMTFYNAFEKVVGLSIDDFQELLIKL